MAGLMRVRVLVGGCGSGEWEGQDSALKQRADLPFLGSSLGPADSGRGYLGIASNCYIEGLPSALNFLPRFPPTAEPEGSPFPVPPPHRPPCTGHHFFQG